MPNLNGLEMASEIRTVAPNQKIILMSGYSEDASGELFGGNGGYGFLEKPFRINSLVKAVQAALD
ncbi:MAG: Response regulator receiver domain [Candidatus Sumerlaeota bacterium]|nr:Response regulator receiver domain [Candidatus Sumerlaeota bacterium]